MQIHEGDRNPLLVRGSQERQALALQLTTVRRHEVRKVYETNRKPIDYDALLGGYGRSLEYVRQLDGTNLVLDIGAGTTGAISGISKMPGGRGLDFRATALVYTPEIGEYLGRERTHITPAEILRGIDNNSVGLALAVYSITYAINPAAAINRIDEVLAPGGILKGVFRYNNKGTITLALSTPRKPFEERLKELNYDVAFDEEGIMLAKKPGGNIAINAQDLLIADFFTGFKWARMVQALTRVKLQKEMPPAQEPKPNPKRFGFVFDRLRILKTAGGPFDNA